MIVFFFFKEFQFFFFLLEGKFFLVNYNGKRQIVNLAIEEGKSPALTWGKEVDSKAYFSDIKNVSFGNANGKYEIFCVLSFANSLLINQQIK